MDCTFNAPVVNGTLTNTTLLLSWPAAPYASAWSEFSAIGTRTSAICPPPTNLVVLSINGTEQAETIYDLSGRNPSIPREQLPAGGRGPLPGFTGPI